MILSTWPRCGHSMTPSNTYAYADRAPRCLRCKRKAARVYAARKTAEERAERPAGWMPRHDQLVLARVMECELKQLRAEKLKILEAA